MHQEALKFIMQYIFSQIICVLILITSVTLQSEDLFASSSLEHILYQ